MKHTRKEYKTRKIKRRRRNERKEVNKKKKAMTDTVLRGEGKKTGRGEGDMKPWRLEGRTGTEEKGMKGKRKRLESYGILKIQYRSGHGDLALSSLHTRSAFTS